MPAPCPALFFCTITHPFENRICDHLRTCSRSCSVGEDVGCARLFFEITGRILKPHWKLLVATVLLLIIDVAGALYIPTLAAEIFNEGTSGSTFEVLLGTGIQMAGASLLSGVCAIAGGY